MSASQLTKIHHLNFLFEDLETAVGRFESALGLGPFEFDELPARGVRTARARVGESWIVLVSPAGAPDSAPMRYLREHGEGFFLVSFGVADLDRAIADLESSRGTVAGPVRDGIAGWRVADLPEEETAGIPVQIAEDTGNAG